jgi:NAD(P)-dependent dehydrogenase (short-subunit alcohol dehydrogenase family)
VNTGKVVVVTGASTGFGRLIAQTLARSGYRVLATMRDLRGRNAAAAAEMEALGLDVLEIDVTDDDSVERGIGEAMARCGRIDVLVNNAGYGIVDLAESVTVDQAKRLFDTNFFGAMRMNRAVLPAMRAQGNGLLLHISSGAGRLAIPAMAVYCASKFALEALAEAYRYELAALGIDSVAVEPGAYRTPIVAKLERGEDPSRRAGYGELAGLPEKMSAAIGGSQADPQEIADAVLQIIETPAGQRQLRYRVTAKDLGISALNRVSDEVHAKMLEAYGIAEMAKFRGN